MRQPDLNTEDSLPGVADAELWPTEQALAAMLQGQTSAIDAVRDALPELSIAVAAAAERLRRQGRLVYAGAGASARLAVQDGVELYPTFGWPHERLATVIAGGTAALTRSIEGAEDDVAAGQAAAAALQLGANDVVISVAASGTTKFTLAVQATARQAGALTIGLANNPGSPLLAGAEIPVPLPTGAEFLAGSTRMAAGTAQKIALNLFSTRLMTELGRVYRGKMVGVVPTNAKLIIRAHRIVAELTGVELPVAADAHEAADGDIRLAVLMLDGLSRTAAQSRLDAAGGNLRVARGF
jgi:N-acetylmuramic acid 6-phosphate etherase